MVPLSVPERHKTQLTFVMENEKSSARVRMRHAQLKHRIAPEATLHKVIPSMVYLGLFFSLKFWYSNENVWRKCKSCLEDRTSCLSVIYQGVQSRNRKAYFTPRVFLSLQIY